MLRHESRKSAIGLATLPISLHGPFNRPRIRNIQPGQIPNLAMLRQGKVIPADQMPAPTEC